MPKLLSVLYSSFLGWFNWEVKDNKLKGKKGKLRQTALGSVRNLCLKHHLNPFGCQPSVVGGCEH